jgi:hypothetical protein
MEEEAPGKEFESKLAITTYFRKYRYIYVWNETIPREKNGDMCKQVLVQA